MPAIPLVTVGLPFYNAERTLHVAIESVMQQTYRNWELILIDDASRDSSLLTARLYASTDSRITLITHERNTGLAPRLNEIAEKANGEYICRMDSDDIMHPKRIERQVRFLNSHATVDVFGTSVYVIDGEYRILGVRGARTHNVCDRLSYVHFVHPSIMGRTSWFRANKYSDAFLRCEDTELWLRTGGGPNMAHTTEPLLFYNAIINCDVSKTLSSLSQYRKILSLHRDRICALCRMKEQAISYGKSAAYFFAARCGALEFLIRSRVARSELVHETDANEVLRGILEASRSRMASFGCDR
jgi:glycosyltransferase involved in cell wall biosynthesis